MNVLEELKHFVVKTFVMATILGVVLGVTASSWLPYWTGEVSFGPYLSWSEDPRYTITISWYWDRNVSGYVILWNDSGFKTVIPTEPAKLHHVVVRGLSPGSYYHYVVGYYAGDRMYNWSDVKTFRTAPDWEEPFTFLVQADTQMHETGLGALERAIDAMAKENFSFILHLGDLVQADKYDWMWARFLRVESKIAAEHPLMAILGNHEYLEYGRNEGKNYRRYMELPGNEMWYYFNYSNAVFIALGVYDYENFTFPEEEREMLERLLSDDSKWRIVYFHIPAISNYPGATSPLIPETLLPIFSKYRPDLVIAGHVHGYARRTINGTCYVTLSSAGGLPAGWIDDPHEVEAYSMEYGYALVTINGDTLTFVFKDLSGDLLDSFTLRR